MRYSGRALLLFGAGGVLGLALVSMNLTAIGWTASLTMAAGLVLLPVALVADWWSHRPWRKPPTGRNRKRTARPKARSKSSPKRKRRPRGK